MFAESTFAFFFSDFIFNGTFITMKSMMNCAALCLSTLGCTSFFYNMNLESCSVSLERYQVTIGLTPDAGYQYHRMPSVIGRACATNADFPNGNFRCYQNMCDCNFGYSYDSSQTNCFRRCTAYGNKYSALEDVSVKRCNVKTVYTTPEGCMQTCTDETSFVCKNVDYRSASKQCHLCDVAWHDLSSLGRQYGQYGWTVYHRHCVNA